VSTVSSIDKLKKDLKSMKKSFTTINTQLTLLKEADSDISDSEGDEEASYFQMDETLQFAQVDKEFENCQIFFSDDRVIRPSDL
jgi:Tfp pilus assembly protein PilO